jgi:hypothetical protein
MAHFVGVLGVEKPALLLIKILIEDKQLCFFQVSTSFIHMKCISPLSFASHAV